MGYFSNGSEGDNFRERYCEHCIHWVDEKDELGAGCPIMDAHVLYGYEECGSRSNAESILNLLIKRKSGPVNECVMFSAVNEVGEAGDA